MSARHKPRPAVLAQFGRCRVDVCCNDDTHGQFGFRAAAIGVLDVLHLEADDLTGPVFRELPDHIVISGRKFEISAMREWYTSMLWNAYWLTVADTVALLEFVRGRGKFHCDSAMIGAGEIWDRPGDWNDADREALGRMIGKTNAEGK